MNTFLDPENATLEDALEVVDDTDSDEDAALDIEPAARRVKTDKQDVPVETLASRAQKGRLDLQPDFQRNFVWDDKKASRLIESILLQIPIPVVYVAEDDSNRWSVIDGQQRLSSMLGYVNGQLPYSDRPFALGGLQVLSELNGKQFKQLDDESQQLILNTTIRLIVIEKQSHPDVKFEMFERLNLGAMKLKDQELRNCIYRGSYNTLLRELAKNQYMLKVMQAKKAHQRMADCQLILRFLTMERNTHLKYRAPMKQFLNREMEAYKNAPPREIDRMRKVFEKSLELSWLVFGPHAFHRFNAGNEKNPNGKWELRKLNVALWDTVMYTFSFFEKPQIVPAIDRIREGFLDLLVGDEKFIDYISSTTDKPERVRYRAEIWRERLEAIVGTPTKEPRAFSRFLKRELYDAKPTCSLCGQHITDIDDAEVDHVEHYWRGGKTIPENAALVHRYCNRRRGGH
jgi:hypothetical protein